MPEKLKISPNDLVLEVSENVDPKKFDISKYEDFMDAVFGNRYYHKEAAKKALFYFLGGNYKNLKDLALQNYKKMKFYKKIFQNKKILRNIFNCQINFLQL